MLRVALPGDAPSELVRVGELLRALAVVEYAYIQALGVPPPGDIAPTTPDLTGNQGYLLSDPGVNVAPAWALGVRGAGVRIADCEFGWNPAHEEFNDIDTQPERGQTPHPSVFLLRSELP